MTPEAMRIAAALDDLARLAGVSPAETSDSAASAVCAVLAAKGCAVANLDELSCPIDSPVSRWLRAEAKVAAGVLVGETKVLVRHRPEPGVVRDECVPLPPVIAAALRYASVRKPRSLVREVA